MGSTFFRIPAIAAVGSTLVAAFDQRNGSSADLPNDIDVMTSRSTDGGVTWSAPATLSAHTGGSTQSTANGCGDPSLLYDPAAGKLLCFYLRAPAGVGLATSDNTVTTGSTTTVHPCMRTSTDGGVTWSAEVDLITQVKTTAMNGIFATSGHGWVDNAGMLYQPYSWFPTANPSALSSAVATSTDHGVTWHMGSVIGTTLDEHHVIVRSDGTLLDDSRNGTGQAPARVISTAPSVTGTWTRTTVTDLPDPLCNGDVIRVDPSDTGPLASWLLSSNASSTVSRANLMVRLSRDNGVTWPVGWTVYNGGAAYSSMVRLPDGTFVILWEDTDHACLQATRFTLEALPY